jgi:para-aminobenzoate synthetase/4-amino-4-deoxychorismate lyase
MSIFSDKFFDKPLQTITAFSTEEVKKAFDIIETLKTSYYVLMYLRYEARCCFLDLDIQSDKPLLYAEVYSSYKPYTPNPAQEVSLSVHPSIFYDDYDNALTAIHSEIALGNTYEVNFTYDFYVDYNGSDMVLYENLLSKQKTPYNSFIKNEWDTVLSFSPELFFKIDWGTFHILTKPMKGTSRRGRDAIEDESLKNFLQNDIKNRAENVMIVDLLRNDLGQIAKTQSVRVSKLFEIETHPTVHQMTSQIEADLKDNTTLYDVFKALYPCGSITGAPKISTMNIIDSLEKGRRSIYCGAIGLLSPPNDCSQSAQAVFSVPIRILQREKHYWKYRSGGAIVWDSNIQDEWMETITKANILNSEFQLIETMKSKDGTILYLDEHLARLQKSALYFNYVCNIDSILREIQKHNGMVRILLFKSGKFTIEYKDIVDSCVNKVRISPLTVDSKSIFLYHKTTVRPYYHVNYNEYYDELFFNEKGELTEGSRTNVVVEIDNQLWTAPVSCGLLNGVMRQKMLETGECREKALGKNDICCATHIYCINSVRGKKEVFLV